MPDKTIKRRLQYCDAALVSDDGPIFSTVTKLVEALKRSIPEGTQNAELKQEALAWRVNYSAVLSTKRPERDASVQVDSLVSQVTGPVTYLVLIQIALFIRFLPVAERCSRDWPRNRGEWMPPLPQPRVSQVFLAQPTGQTSTAGDLTGFPVASAYCEP